MLRIGRVRRPQVLASAVVVILALAACADDEVISLADVAPPIGSCFRAPTGEPTDEGNVFDEVDCAEEHVGEVIGRVELDATLGAPVPDAGELRVAAVDACVGVFEDYVGIAYLESRFTLQPITPDATTWADGDRSIACIVVQLGVAPGEVVDEDTGTQVESRTGSVRGAAE